MKETQELIKEREEIIKKELDRNREYFIKSNFDKKNWRKIVLRDLEDNDYSYGINYNKTQEHIKIKKQWLKQVEDEIGFLEEYLIKIKELRVNVAGLSIYQVLLDSRLKELTTLKEDLIKDIKESEDLK